MAKLKSIIFVAGVRPSPVSWARRLWMQEQQWSGGCLCSVVCGGVVHDRRHEKENRQI